MRITTLDGRQSSSRDRSEENPRGGRNPASRAGLFPGSAARPILIAGLARGVRRGEFALACLAVPCVLLAVVVGDVIGAALALIVIGLLVLDLVGGRP